MKYLIALALLLLAACGREGLPDRYPIPGGPGLKYTPKPPLPLPTPPATVQLALIYKTYVAGVLTDCFVEKTVEFADADDHFVMGDIYERYCDYAKPCKFSHQPGEQWKFQITTVTDPPDTTPGMCDWNLPEAI